MGYDLISPANPTVKILWNDATLSYDPPSLADPILDHHSTFHHTVGMVGDIVRDPNTGLIVYDPVTLLPSYSEGNGRVTATLPPGYYPNGMRLTTGDDINLAQSSSSGPGTFFIWGGGDGSGGGSVGIVMNAGSLTGNGVTCYVTQNFDTGVPGELNITGGYLDIDSPGDWTNQEAGTTDMSLVEGLNGIAIWQDPTALDPATGEPPEAHLNGNGDFHISGTIYLPDPIHMRLEGDLGDTGNQILCGTLNIRGTAALHVNYDGRNYGITNARVCLVH